MPGGPAPWAGHDQSTKRAITLDLVRRVFAERVGPAGGTPTSSAVLVALFEEAGEARVVLTRRAGHLRRNPAEVAFPGGRLEPGELPVAAALREAAEEVALDPRDVEIIGELAPLATISGTSITPFVGVLASRPTLRPNPAEVEHAFDVALADLLGEDVFEAETWTTRERGERPMFFFHLEEDTIWGATARVLMDLLTLVVK